jgi:beta-carotene hydroxylase
MLRHPQDRKTLLWAFVLIPGVPALQYAFPALLGWLLPLSLYLGFVSGAIAHNHNHSPTFRSRGLNAAFAVWLSILYGAPIFGWIPTHNQNHHRFLNGPGDATITWRYGRANRLRSVLAYFFVSNWFQAPLISDYLRKLRASNPALHRQTVVQRVAVVAAYVGMFGLAVGLHGLARGALVYLIGFGIQVVFALWSMFGINFVQHVDCDPRSKRDHSRNFVGKWHNRLMFNGGYHTAHHEQPGLHWSALPALHAELAPEIDPRLNQSSLLWFIFCNYALGAVVPRFRTTQVGRAAWARESRLVAEFDAVGHRFDGVDLTA